MTKAQKRLAFLSWGTMLYDTALPLSAGIPESPGGAGHVPRFHLWRYKLRLAGLLRTPQMAEAELWSGQVGESVACSGKTMTSTLPFSAETVVASQSFPREDAASI